MKPTSSSAAREVILARVREALRVPASLPHGLADSPLDPARGGRDQRSPTSGQAGLPALTVLPEQAARPWLPDGGDTPAARLQLLVDNLGKLRATVHRPRNPAEAAAQIAAMARDRGWRRVAWHPHPLVDPVAAQLPCDGYRLDAAGFDKNALEACDAGITSCEAVVAQTGSILVSSGTCGGRSLSILPHVHVVIASLDQIVGTLADALHAAKMRHGGGMPSMLSFITGPSRTGDIERILVLGAHGPKELVVLLVG